MEQPPYETDSKLAEYLTRQLTAIQNSIDQLKNLRVSNVYNANGLKFPATQVPSSNANTLDDYEEGVFNPVVTAGTGTITSYTSSGTYTKIGRLVSFHFVITITDNGSGASYINITYPFVSAVYFCGVAREYITTGHLCSVNAGGSGNAYIVKYDNSYPATTGCGFNGSITFSV
jgi:hypothetical protein